MEKHEVDGNVAVLYSPGYGAGWSTWNTEHRDVLCMDREIVEAVIAGDLDKAVEIAERKCPDIYPGGAGELKVGWVPKGQAFEITEYDGAEHLVIIGEQQYMIA